MSCVWDFRSNEDNWESDKLIIFLKKHCKKWTFQKEKGDTGYIHWQGRFSLIKKRMKGVLLKIDGFSSFNYLEPTNSDHFLDEYFYAMKEDTRIEGPWSDKSEKTEEKYIPIQYRNLTLRPWQNKIVNATVMNTRQINLIYDERGNSGKSTVASVSELLHNGIDMPPLNDFKELLALLHDICKDGNLRSPSPIFFDLPRALDKSKLYGLYSAIEQVKKGKLYDCRYHYSSWWIDSPTIWVFSNILPDANLLSNDRWCIWCFDETKENLIPYEEPTEYCPLDA